MDVDALILQGLALSKDIDKEQDEGRLASMAEELAQNYENLIKYMAVVSSDIHIAPKWRTCWQKVHGKLGKNGPFI